MRAVYKTAFEAGNVSLQDRPIPKPDARDNVLIRVKACAVCGMDFHMYHGKFPCTPPFIMGHEFVGVVEEIQGGTGRVHVGDRVVAQPHLYSCMQCEVCKLGLTQFCKERRSIGIHRDGAMTSYVVVPEEYLHVVPQTVPDKLACILEPFSMVVGNLGIPVREEQAQTVLVVGAGQIGLLGVVAAKGCGAKQVVLSGVERDRDLRLPTGLKLGADFALDSTVEDPVKKIMELTNGQGADIVLEASGAESGINAAFAAVKPGGLLCVMGGTKRDSVSVNWDVCLKKAVRVHFHMMSNYEYMDDAIQIFANPYTDLSPLISHEYPLDRWQEAFDAMADGSSIKNVIYVD